MHTVEAIIICAFLFLATIGAAVAVYGIVSAVATFVGKLISR